MSRSGNAWRASGHTGRLNTIAIEPRFERRAVTSSDDGTAIVWALDAPGERVAVLRTGSPWVATAAFLPELDEDSAPDDLLGAALVATAGGDGIVAVWDAATGAQLRRIAEHSGEVTSLVPSAKGRFLLTASADKTCRLHDLLSQIEDAPPPHAAAVAALLDLSAQRRMLSFGADGSVCLWDTETGTPLRAAAVANAPRFVAASPDGSRAAMCAGNSAVAVWDAASMTELASMPAVMGSRVKFAAFSGDCLTVALVLFDSTVTLWDVPAREVIWRPQARAQRSGSAHTGGVNTCHLSAVRPLHHSALRWPAHHPALLFGRSASLASRCKRLARSPPRNYCGSPLATPRRAASSW
jgi:WD40 repeat protein